MKKSLLLLLSLFLSVSLQAQTEKELITETLNNYIEGSTGGQPEKLKTAFYSGLNLYYIRNGELRIWKGTDYINDTKEDEPTGETGKILSIDYENNIAIAKVEITPQNGSRSFIDYFLLAKVKERWTIIHKAYTVKTSE